METQELEWVFPLHYKELVGEDRASVSEVPLAALWGGDRILEKIALYLQAEGLVP